MSQFSHLSNEELLDDKELSQQYHEDVQNDTLQEKNTMLFTPPSNTVFMQPMLQASGVPQSSGTRTMTTWRNTDEERIALQF